MKLRFLLKNKCGYAFPLVLMIVTIISLLGVSILGLAITNFKLQTADSKEKQNYYLTEAGLDETYVLLQKEISDKINSAKTYAQDVINDRIRAEQSQDPDDNPVYDLTNADGSINSDRVNTELKILFKDNYKKNVNDNLITDLSTQSYKGTVKGLTLSFHQDDNNSWKYNVNDLSDQDEKQNFFKFKTVSNLSGKEVKTIFKIRVPSYEQTYITNVVKSANENILWLRPITVEGKILTASGDVQINGEVYTFGGADISSGSNTTINGNFYSAGDINKKATNSESSLQILGGNVYCSSLRTLSDGGSTGKNNVGITGNLFTYDDIELNGNKSNVIIDGSYYGFSDGSDRSTSTTKFTEDDADKSSCILVNADDIKTGGSHLKITGQVTNTQYRDKETLNMGRIGLYPGVIVAGTAYVNPQDSSNLYQTGESISIKGNYRAYSKPLWGITNIDGNNYNASNMIFDKYGNLQLANKFKTFILPDNTTSGNHILFPFERSNYFQQVDSLYETASKDGIDIPPARILYTAGAWIGKENNVPLIGRTSNQSYVETYRVATAKDFKYYTNKLGDLKYDNNVLADPKFNNHRDLPDAVLNSRVYISNYAGREGRFDFSKYSTGNSFSGGELTYVAENKTPIAIIGPGGNADGLPEGTIKYTTTEPLKGIVITGGDVHIRGNVSFTGILISEGDLSFEGSGVKIVNYNKRYVLKRIAENDSLKAAFVNSNESLTDNINISSTVDFPDLSNYATIGNLITVSDWDKTR